MMIDQYMMLSWITYPFIVFIGTILWRFAFENNFHEFFLSYCSFKEFQYRLNDLVIDKVCLLRI